MSRVKVTTHSGESYETEIESYDPIKLNSDLNDIQLNTVLIGDVILAKIDVKGVFKLPDPPEEPVDEPTEEPAAEPAEESTEEPEQPVDETPSEPIEDPTAEPAEDENTIKNE